MEVRGEGAEGDVFGGEVTSKRQRCTILETNQKALFNGAVSERTSKRREDATKIANDIRVYQKQKSSLSRCLSQQRAGRQKRLTRSPMRVYNFKIEWQRQGVSERKHVRRELQARVKQQHCTHARVESRGEYADALSVFACDH